MKRTELSLKHIGGSGLECGPLHCPAVVKPGVQVTYVDRGTKEEIARAHADVEIKDLPIVICDTQYLHPFENQSQDFVIAHHVFEHLENPLEAFREWVRVLKPGGIILFSLPDRSETFDKQRKNTPLLHLIKDYLTGTYCFGVDSYEHYVDWYANSELEGKEGQELYLLSTEANEQKRNIHFHCWDYPAQLNLLKGLEALFEVKTLESHKDGSEGVFVMQKINDQKKESV